jgi:hypothetical protein
VFGNYSLRSKKIQISFSEELHNFKFDQIYKKITNICVLMFLNRFNIEVYYIINLMILIL